MLNIIERNNIVKSEGRVNSKHYTPDPNIWMKIEDCNWSKQEHFSINSYGDIVRIEIRFSENGRWILGDATYIESEPNGHRVDIIKELTSLSLLNSADGIVSVGLASQEIEKDNPSNEISRAGNRSSNLMGYIRRSVKEEKDHRFYQLNLGRYLEIDNNISPYQSSDQRRVIVIGIFSQSFKKMSDEEIKEKVMEALSQEHNGLINKNMYSTFQFMPMQYSRL